MRLDKTQLDALRKSMAARILAEVITSEQDRVVAALKTSDSYEELLRQQGYARALDDLLKLITET